MNNILDIKRDSTRELWAIFGRTKFIFIAVLLLSTGFLMRNRLIFYQTVQEKVERFQAVLHEKEHRAMELAEEVAVAIGTREDKNTSLQFSLHEYYGIFERENIAILVTIGDSVIYWSDNIVLPSLPFQYVYPDSTIIHARNAWYLTRKKEVNGKTVKVLALIKQEYPYQNKFISNRFGKGLQLSSSVKISQEKNSTGYPVLGSGREYLFSLHFDAMEASKTIQVIVPAVLYFLAYLCLMFQALSLFNYLDSRKSKNRLFYLYAMFFAGIWWASLYDLFPDVFLDLGLFNPVHYASSWYLPSLGHLLLNALSMIFLAYSFFRHFTFRPELTSNGWGKEIRSVLYMAFLVIYFLLTGGITENLVYNSSICLEPHRILDLTLYSFMGLLIILLNLAAFSLMFYKGFGRFVILYSKQGVLWRFFLLWLLLSLLIQSLWGTSYVSMSFFIPVLLLFWFYFFNGYVFRFSNISLLLVLYSIFMVTVISFHSRLKEQREKEVLVMNLSSEHDPVAELLLEEMDYRFSSDTLLFQYVSENYLDIGKIYQHIRRKHLSGFWEKYNLQVTACVADDSLYLVPPDDIMVSCYPFFNEMIKNRGVRLGTSRFYFMDNHNGRISYLGRYVFDKSSGNEVSLFIELDSRLVAEELGYPELLLGDNLVRRNSARKNFYAKYNNGALISQTGKYPYSLSSRVFEQSEGKLFQVVEDGFDHLVYRPDKDNIIVLSTPLVGLFDYLISFSYIFSLFFIITALCFLGLNLKLVRKNFVSNFKNKILLAMLSVVFLSLVTIGTGTLYMSMMQYRTKHNEWLGEKIQSLYIELIHKLAYEHDITRGWKSHPYDNLQELLIKFSNVFYIDINLYTPAGELLASSRPEIFDRGLIGRHMNPKAYRALIHESRAEIIHNEQVGEMTYLSAYVPFVNNENKLLAYLNLPYFTKQSIISHEISTVFVATINVYLLLFILASFLAVLLSRKITQPLRLLQKKFSEVQLGSKSEHIVYEGNDEIGGLVKEYNRMVDELARSVDLLAKSEREMAWREMAKQIAHEINNPLTPMKLSVQHLQRAWKDKVENYEDYLNRISLTLIEQIDNLSSIATEFSNFAKMPSAKSQLVNLVEKVRNSIHLFANSQVEFVLDIPDSTSTIWVYADKEQLSRVFINLIKNAIQSVPKGTLPVIHISAHSEGDIVKISIKDNGKGIPDEMRDKLFRPNFTTKSGGMGLGLAIVKNIVDNAGGKIYFESTTGQGAIFIVELPLSGTT